MNVLLDLDGTLTDSKKGIIACLQHALRTMGREASEETALIKYVGPPLKSAFRELLKTDSDPEVERAVAAYRERFVAVGMFENEVYPGIPEALQALRDRGVRLFLATSKVRMYAERILEHFQLSRHFEGIYGGELDGRLTDKTELIAHVLAHSGADPARAAMVGDRHHDALGAIANGIKPVGVLWGYGTQTELSSAGVASFLKSPRELGQLDLTNAN